MLQWRNVRKHRKKRSRRLRPTCSARKKKPKKSKGRPHDRVGSCDGGDRRRARRGATQGRQQSSAGGYEQPSRAATAGWKCRGQCVARREIQIPGRGGCWPNRLCYTRIAPRRPGDRHGGEGLEGGPSGPRRRWL